MDALKGYKLPGPIVICLTGRNAIFTHVWVSCLLDTRISQSNGSPANFRSVLEPLYSQPSEPTAGKFFEMPKSTKAPPPQQSSLQEMWGKKKGPKKPVASKPEPSAMEVDIPEEKEGECNTNG